MSGESFSNAPSAPHASGVPNGSADQPFDLLVIGGGINGCGIARDAAGRGLSVMLVEQDDLASATSGWSSKLIHGGLRYLEYYQFRLVAESLAEREVLLRAAPHLIEPLQFVIPHEPHQRPRWMIRAGLYLYDFLGGKKTVPASKSVVLQGSAMGAGLKAAYTNGFSYYDARADDARLTILNARGAADLGAVIAPYTRFVSAAAAPHAGPAAQHPPTSNHTAAPGHGSAPNLWRITLQDVATLTQSVCHARAIVNAAGPWVMRVLGGVKGTKPSAERVRHVKGSHIVVPRVHAGEHAYLLQHRDNRIVFVIPFHDQFTLIGTTDIAVEAWEQPAISDDETRYLCAIASEYLEHPLTPADVLWSYSGVRPLYDDGRANASAITRDYVLKLDPSAGAPLLNVFGGKLTTYRRLAEHALAKLAPHFPDRPRGMIAWTAGAPLPGGDFSGGLAALEAGLQQAYPFLPPAHLHGIAKRHGTRARLWLGAAQRLEDLGEHFGAGLYAAEADHMMAAEWARPGVEAVRYGEGGAGYSSGQDRSGQAGIEPSSIESRNENEDHRTQHTRMEPARTHNTDGVLMRRSKCGLFMTPEQKARVSAYLNPP